jgi:hypothetical protein
MIYLNVDKNNYLLSVATVGGGVEADIDLSKYDLSGDRIRAHKWENDTLIFDADRYTEIEAENEQPQEEETTPKEEGSVYDELAAAYKQGVQEA